VVAMVKRQPAAQHLVHDNASAPPINCTAIIRVFEHLRSQIFGCSAESVGCSVVGDVLLAQPEISNLNVPVLVQKQVLQLQVSVNYIVEMQITGSKGTLGNALKVRHDEVVIASPQSRNDFGSIEASTFLGKNFIVLQMEIQFAAVDVLHHEAEALVSAERIFQRLIGFNEMQLIKFYSDY